MKFDEESFGSLLPIKVGNHECWPEAWPHCYIFTGKEGDSEEAGSFMEWALEDFKKFIKSKWIEYGELQNE